MSLKEIVNSLLNPLNVQIKKYPDKHLGRRIRLIKHFNINKIFDIGASVGNYGKTLKKLGYDGTIISCEPISSVYQKLNKNSKRYKNWIAQNYALGDNDMETYINISGNSDSSSILNILPNHLNSSEGSKYVNKEKIQVKKLDTIFPEFYKPGDNIMIKIDTQGFEKQVLDGGQLSLPNIKGIQIEMSFIPLYEGGILFSEMKSYLESKGYELYSIETGFTDPKTGRLLQMDGIFFRP